MPAALAASFYDRRTEWVARDLLGTILRCESPEGVATGRIVETEAYLGEHDLACHAAAGRTARTEGLYGDPGTAYIYFTYGMHWCANAVTRRVGLPSAVLIRALEPLEGLELMASRRPKAHDRRDLTNGPAKLCAALAITGELNGVPLRRSRLTIHEGITIPRREIAITPRIGITRSVDWPLRWIWTRSEYLSRPYRP